MILDPQEHEWAAQLTAFQASLARLEADPYVSGTVRHQRRNFFQQHIQRLSALLVRHAEEAVALPSRTSLRFEGFAFADPLLLTFTDLRPAATATGSRSFVVDLRNHRTQLAA